MIDKKEQTGQQPPAGLSNRPEVKDIQSTQVAKIKKWILYPLIVEGNIKIFNTMQCPRDILCIKYNEEFDYLAAGYSNGVIKVFKSNSGEELFTLIDKEIETLKSPCTSIKTRNLSKLYPITNCYTATYACGVVKCWNYHFNQCVYTIREKRQTFGLAYHPKFSKFISFGDDLKINFYDEETKTLERIFGHSEYQGKHDGPMSRVFGGVFHPKNFYEFVTGGWDDTIQFWDVRQPYAIRHISGCHICADGIDISPRGNEILTCSFQITDPLQLFEYNTGNRTANLQPDFYNCKLYCGRYLNNDFVLTGGSDPNLLRVVDLQTASNVCSINNLVGGVYCLDIGAPRKQKYEKEKQDFFTEDTNIRMKADLSILPRVAFLSGKKIYQLDFY